MDQEFKPNEDNKPIETSTSDEVLQPSTEFKPEVVAEPSVTVPSDEIMQSIEEKDSTPVIKQTITTPGSKSAKKGHGKTIFVILLIILLVAAGVVAYWWRDKTATESINSQATSIDTLKAEIKTLDTELAEAKLANPVDCDLPCTPTAPSATAIENIQASITSGNTAALASYMATTVRVVLAASEGLGSVVSAEAASSVSDFISTATEPWDFALSASLLGQYVAGSYGPYFPSIAVVGASANHKLISFDFDCDGKISTVFMVSDQSILQ